MLNALLSKLKKEQNDSHMLDLSAQIKEKNRKIELQNELLKFQNTKISELNSDILKMSFKIEKLQNENSILNIKKNIMGNRLIEKAEEIKTFKMELKQEIDSKLNMEREYNENMDIRNFILDKAFSELCNLLKSKESFSNENCLCLQAVIKDLLGTAYFNIYAEIYNLINGKSKEFKDLGEKRLHLELLNPGKESTYPVDVDALVINEQVLRLIKGYLAISKFYDMAISEFKFNNDYDDYGQEYEFIEDGNLNNIAKPECDCGEYEISDTFTVRGHKINSNCDTWGTDCGVPAESLYVFYLPEKDRYIFIKEWYMEM